MIATPTTEPAAARERLAYPERTVANELPQELSQLPEQYRSLDAHSFLKRGKAATCGGSRKKAGRPKRAVAVTKTRKRAVMTTTGFMDDDHPTILAAANGLIRPS